MGKITAVSLDCASVIIGLADAVAFSGIWSVEHEKSCRNVATLHSFCDQIGQLLIVCT